MLPLVRPSEDQRTRISAHADGLDATALVTFATQDAQIAQVSTARHDVIEGMSAGDTTVHSRDRQRERHANHDDAISITRDHTNPFAVSWYSCLYSSDHRESGARR